MGLPTVCIVIPTHDGRVHCQTMAGCLQAVIELPGRVRVEKAGGSFLPILRDRLTRTFLDSEASYMLCLDSDIGWASSDLVKLLETEKDMVSGVYTKKQKDREIPAKQLKGGAVEGPLLECEYVPGGFLLVSRAAVERMVGAYRDLEYRADVGRLWGLWYPSFDRETGYDGEDVAFVRRWRKLGGKVWLHTGVVLSHWGEQCYLPELAASS